MKHPVFSPAVIIAALIIVVFGELVSGWMTIKLMLAQGAASTTDAFLNGGTGFVLELAKIAFPGIAVGFILMAMRRDNSPALYLAGMVFAVATAPLIYASWKATELQMLTSMAATEQTGVMESAGYQALKQQSELLSAQIADKQNAARAATSTAESARAALLEIEPRIATAKAELRKWQASEKRPGLFQSKIGEARAEVERLEAQARPHRDALSAAGSHDVSALLDKMSSVSQQLAGYDSGAVAGLTAPSKAFETLAAATGMTAEEFKYKLYRGLGLVMEILMVMAAGFLAAVGYFGGPQTEPVRNIPAEPARERPVFVRKRREQSSTKQAFVGFAPDGYSAPSSAKGDEDRETRASTSPAPVPVLEKSASTSTRRVPRENGTADILAVKSAGCEYEEVRRLILRGELKPSKVALMRTCGKGTEWALQMLRALANEGVLVSTARGYALNEEYNNDN